MVLRAEQAGGWEIVRPPGRYDGVELVGYHDRAGQGLDMRVLPEPGVTIVLVLDGELRIDRTRPVGTGIASGVGVRSVPVAGREVACVDIHLSPLAAYSVLGGSVAELAGTVVGLEDLWGAKAHRLRAALAGADRWDDRFGELHAALAEELHTNRPVDPEVAFAWRRLVVLVAVLIVLGLLLRAGFMSAALTITHVADVRLQSLSGGERQRVSIARALLKRAPIVVLDEATAALDPENERYLRRSIRELARHSTVLLIAHRLNTVVDADQIVVVEDGRVVETGTHHSLLAADGSYARFWHARSSGGGYRAGMSSAMRGVR